VVKDSSDLGWFQAPANVAFVIIGLLYGQGDFSKTLCIATNCGDDTDCTAATAGSIMGILKGRSGIPNEWIEPIGETIQTIAINAVHVKVPKTLSELTNRVATVALSVQDGSLDPDILRIGDAPTCISSELKYKMSDNSEVAAGLLARSPYELTFDLPYMRFSIVYDGGPTIAEGEPKKLLLIARHPLQPDSAISLNWSLPEGWCITPAQQYMLIYRDLNIRKEVMIVPGKITEAVTYIPLTVKLVDRGNPITLNVPFQCQGAVSFWENIQWSEECFERLRLERSRRLVESV
jgi:hypothetical protein